MLWFWPSRCKWHGLPSLLPLIVVSDEMLWAWELKEFKLSRELSLLCTPPPSPPSACPPLRWCRSSRSAYQLSPNPLSRMLLSCRLDVSCRAFYADTNTQMSKLVFTIQQSRPHLHLWIGVIMGECVCLCVFIGGGWNLLSRTVDTHTTLSIRTNACCNWTRMMPLSFILCIQCQNKRRLVPCTLMTMFTAQKQWNCTWTHKPI